MKDEFRSLKFGGIAMLILAAVILMGIAVTGQFSDEIRDVQTTIDQITLPAENVSVSLGKELVTSVTSCANATGDPFTNYDVDPGTRTSDGSLIPYYPSAAWEGSNVNCTIVNKESNTGSDSGELFLTALAIFGSFAAIVVLGIMGKAVIDVFKKV